tara:strand:- start:1136 stop:2182 length:1047 start_codon:yes stop_codon:yes gene_type:complete
MSFFDKKEEVMDIQLTSYGKELLSKGDFKPMYYAFFDEGIMYDGGRASVTEVQNDVQDRIKNNTPYIKHTADFLSSKEIAHMKELVPNDFDARELSLFDFNSSFENQLGASNNNKDKAPAWSITALQSEILSSNTFLTSSANSRNLPIPQINIDADSISYDVSVVEDRLPNSERRCEIDNFMEGAVAEFEDGTSLEIRDGVILLKVKEENSLNLRNAFDFELFEVKAVTGSIKAQTDRQVLSPLKFFKFKPQIENGIIVSDGYSFGDVQNLEKIDNSFVSNYLEILIDDEVDQEAVCRLDKNRKGNSLFVKDPINCETIPPTERGSVYDTVDDGDIETLKSIIDGECD